MPTMLNLMFSSRIFNPRFRFRGSRPGITLFSSQRTMAPGLARKYEINADMGEGFGRWKMVCLATFFAHLFIDRSQPCLGS
jgi:hypothetical protein